MLQFAIILTCITGGFLLKRFNVFKPNTYLWLNKFVLFVSLPAITLLNIPIMEFSTDLWVPISTAWIVFIAGALVFIVLGKLAKWDNATIGCLILTCGLFNSSFVGFPVIEALYGAEGLKMAIMVDQPGSFLVLSTLGVGTAVYYSTATQSLFSFVKKLITFPPLIAFVVALLIRLVSYHIPEMGVTVLQVLAKTLAPVALLSVGAQLQFGKIENDKGAMLAGLSYRLILSPLIIFLLWGVFAAEHGLHLQVSVLEAAMPPMITGAIIASEYGLNPKLANNLVAYGILISIISLTGWYFLL